MFVSVRFNPTHDRTYTYAYDGTDAIAPGARCVVETKDGTKTVVVAAVDLEEPAFPCKTILAVLPEKETDE